jgi:hypothetical protein
VDPPLFTDADMRAQFLRGSFCRRVIVIGATGGF